MATTTARAPSGIIDRIKAAVRIYDSEMNRVANSIRLNPNEQHRIGDAFRHSYYSARLQAVASRLPARNPLALALRFAPTLMGYANEIANWGSLSATMDLHNNAVGRSMESLAGNEFEFALDFIMRAAAGEFLVLDIKVDEKGNKTAELRHSEPRDVGVHTWSGIDDRYRADRREDPVGKDIMVA